MIWCNELRKSEKNQSCSLRYSLLEPRETKIAEDLTEELCSHVGFELSMQTSMILPQQNLDRSGIPTNLT
jgi:hypothetical protein